MIRPLLLLCVMACTPLPKANASLPHDVARFIDRRDSCEHFMGEEPYDAERRAFLNKAVAQTCTGNDIRLKKLRTKYTGNALVIGALKNYEDDIEPEVRHMQAAQ